MGESEFGKSEERVKAIFEENILLQKGVLTSSLPAKISETAEIIVAHLREGGKLFIAGNGGSAADAQHFAGELVGKYLHARKALPAIALTTDTSIITAIANDISYDAVFERQLEGLAGPKDVFFAISTSGNSKNILSALEFCKKENIFTIGLTGEGGGKMADAVNVLLAVPSRSTPRIQEVHATIIHIISEIIEQSMMGVAPTR